MCHPRLPCHLLVTPPAYLDLRDIPRTPCADVIRRDPPTVRDAPSRREIPASEYALSLALMSTHEQPQGPSAALGYVQRPGGLADGWISLAGTIAVSWPLPDRPPIV